MTRTANLGFPRIGSQREWKFSLERFWKGEINEDQLNADAKMLRERHWLEQKDRGTDILPSNDFSYYDHVLDTAIMVGCIPERYPAAWRTLKHGEAYSPKLMFAMARGLQDGTRDIKAMEMTKWFDSNYHYIVPELAQSQKFSLADNKPLRHYQEAKALGLETRPVILGPITFLMLAKEEQGSSSEQSNWRHLDGLIPVYQELLSQLKQAGCSWVQIDEPCLGLDLDLETQRAIQSTYHVLNAVDAAQESKTPNLMLTSYFSPLQDQAEWVMRLPVAGIHWDLVRGQEDWPVIKQALQDKRYNKHISLGLIDGRNIWRTDLTQVISTVEETLKHLPSEKVQLAPSCSLLHCPIDLSCEQGMDADIRSWLAFAHQKLEELRLAADYTTRLSKSDTEQANIQAKLDQHQGILESYKASPKVHRPSVDQAIQAIAPEDYQRIPFAERYSKQQEALNLPPFPITSIGSFPQTKEVRKFRRQFKKGELSEQEYTTKMHSLIDEAIEWQDEVGVDVLVHGEFERNDMVEHFASYLEGFAFSQNGWVQSYGSRCVKPPIIYGDVERKQAMTVDVAKYAQSRTHKPVKGMLTGPVTILNWSFVRADQPRRQTCTQIALAIRAETLDLEQAGIGIVQIDEAAFREGLPLRENKQVGYLRWATECFKLASSGVQEKTQIHTHMCYSDFNKIIGAIADLDADVISIETSRSNMKLLDAFVDFEYPNQIGPGVYDIHSPRVPSKDEIHTLLEKAKKVLKPDQIWVNPDCGLKTRNWPEVKAAFEHMVEATREVRRTSAAAAG